jgi:cobalt/nickel transport system ATP-binding protein
MQALSLEIIDVSHRHPGRDRDTPASTSFTLDAGTRGLVLGPNGSGKTTLLLRIVGLLSGPGTVRVGGVIAERASFRAIRRRVGFMWQSPEDSLLLPTVIDDVALGPANDGHERDAISVARQWLERLGIARLALRRIRDLSLGEKQIVALAGVLAREPGLLLLDEPAASLDAAMRDRLAALLAELPMTMLMATHDPAFWSAAPGAWEQAVSLA